MDGNDAKTGARRGKFGAIAVEFGRIAVEFGENVPRPRPDALLEGRPMRLLRRFWKRHVTGTPDRYRAYVSFPIESNRPSLEEIHGRIEELEHVFEGRLDVYARLRSVAVVTDPVSATVFDADAFAKVLERIEADYAESHDLARVEKWRTVDGRLVKSVVAVPVKPLFPRPENERRRVRTPTE